MIEIRNLCKSYENKKVYEHLNLQIAEGQITYLLGASGFGKTTLLRILAGLEGYDEGEIVGLHGKRISYVFQEDRLMPWLTVEENICYVLKGLDKKEQEKRLLWSLGLMKLEAERRSNVQALSGGMKRRVAIARAIVYDSEILLLDEPFKGLDDRLKREIIEQLTSYWQEKKQTVLIVGHDSALAKRFNNHMELESLIS